MRTCLIAVVGSLLGASTLAAQTTPTFYKDVLPILQANCQGCHRPGEVAPMSLLTYEQARPWARGIKAAVASRQAAVRYGINVGHPDVLRAVLQGIVGTGDVLGDAGPGRTVLAVTVDNWLLDELAALGADLEDHEPEPDEDDT